MYDDWGPEIALAETVHPLSQVWPDTGPWSQSDTSDDSLWLQAQDQVHVASDGNDFLLIDDAFVLPSKADSKAFMPKPGSVDDWLTPLSTVGEADLGEIVVTGRPPTSDDYYGDGGDNWNPSHDSDNRDNEGGDGGPTPPPPVTPCDLDQSKDSLAMTLEELIKSMPDWDEREYGALILRDASGYVYRSELVRGETVAEAEARAIAAGETSFEPRTSFGTVPTGFTVIGVVHNHPDIDYDSAADLRNRYPSDYPGGGDYFMFERLVGTDPRFAFPADFTQYILGPDGVLREFDFTEGRVNSTNDTRTDRHDLSADRPCD